MTDHVAPDGSWAVTHGTVRGSKQDYPYDEDDYRAAIDDAVAAGCPLIVAGHDAFDGRQPTRPHSAMVH